MSLVYFDFSYVNTTWIALFYRLVVSFWVLKYEAPWRAIRYDLDSPLISIMQGEIYLCDNDVVDNYVVVMLVTMFHHPSPSIYELVMNYVIMLLLLSSYD